jgi:hypothetical protein
VLVKRKGAAAEHRKHPGRCVRTLPGTRKGVSGGRVDQIRGPTNRNRIRGGQAWGEQASSSEALYPSKALVVDPAGKRGRRSELPQEACVASRRLRWRLRKPRGGPIAAQAVAEGGSAAMSCPKPERFPSARRGQWQGK